MQHQAMAGPVGSQAAHPAAHQGAASPPWAGAPGPPPALRLLTLSSLYPNACQPNHGVFVENRLRHLVSSGAAESCVIAPVPWFPGRSPGPVPAEEARHGLRVLHPRFLAVPKLGLLTNPYALHRAARGALQRLLAQGFQFDAIDAHYLFPDGVAAVWLAREFNKPVVITARGSDTSQLPALPFAGPAIRRVVRQADALVAVSQGLAEGLLALGADPGRVTVLRNGVDTGLFAPPADRAALRAELGFAAPTLISVGLLIPRKRHHLTIEALTLLPEHRLVILGEGPERAALQALAERLGVADRLAMPGARPHAELPRWYGAADAMVLASEREGWANVLLESMGCGTPCVATPAWGMREAISSPAAGLVTDEATPAAIATAVRALPGTAPDRTATRAHAEEFGWDATTQGQLALFRRLLETPRP
jgi:teichuronic acid biosynthesis glycosyltransferase TuaC